MVYVHTRYPAFSSAGAARAREAKKQWSQAARRAASRTIRCAFLWSTRIANSTAGPTAFRLIVAIPILILAASIGSLAPGAHGAWRFAGTTGGVLFLAPLLMIVFRQKYPRWWFDWNLELFRFSNRIGVYLALMDDRYPSTDDGQGVALDFPYPDAKQDLNRWLPSGCGF